ncbi:MAG TPA: cation diffusion facilitator family transporter [Solirubrobacterales bacterium]|jgi:cobalt-zinc-cadmium efflux system protein|nr:cation diffusion facilitator family transporter [Solirubrobacterales bacterium]
MSEVHLLSHSHGHDHGHAHGHAHLHGIARGDNLRRMWGALAINVAMVAVGVTGAIITGSLALLADAGHVFSDVMAIVLGVGAGKMAMRPASGRGTFGLGRLEILAALINGLALVAVSIWISIEAIGRFSDPPTVSGTGVLVFGLVGLFGNAAATVLLAGGDRKDINLEGVLRHSVADALGSIGVALAGLGIILTGWQPLDPIVGLVIALLILLSSWRLIREPVEVLLERAPAGLDVEVVGRTIAAVEGVREVHDLHIWSITSGFPALAAHVTVKATHEPDPVRTAIEALLVERFELSHTTLQVSCEQLVQLEPLELPPGDRG